MAAALETELDITLQEFGELLDAVGESGFASLMSTVRVALLDRTW